MPTNLECSAMKSFSLSSLGSCPASGPAATAAAAGHTASLERPYHSLNKKRKEAWRRSWGSAASGGSAGDDLWPLLQHDYDYIMDSHIIDTCKEASGELCVHNPRDLPTEERVSPAAPGDRDPDLRLRAVDDEDRRGRLLEQCEAVRRLLAAPTDDDAASAEPQQETRRLRRWLHRMEGRLPPPAAARALSPPALRARLALHQVLQRDVECHGGAVSRVLRLSGGSAAARALEQRWHHLYLRAIEWQCHLEAGLACHDQRTAIGEAFDSDEEPALKQPRLSPRRVRRPRTAPAPSPAPAAEPNPATGGDGSCSEDEDWCVEDSSSESECGCARTPRSMASLHEQTVPRTPSRQPSRDRVDGEPYRGPEDECMYEESPAAPAVVKRRKDTSRFNQSDRKSRHCATFYFKHHDTDSERRPSEHDKDDTSEEEWTYRPGEAGDARDAGEAGEAGERDDAGAELKEPEHLESQKMEDELEPATICSDVERAGGERPGSRCADSIGRLVAEAEALVARRPRDQRAAAANKMSRIDEWLRQSDRGDPDQLCGDSYDASGEYTTESEVGGASGESGTEDGAGMDTSVCTLTPASPHAPPAPHTPAHSAKVVLRKKRSDGPPGARPWSVSCLSQLTRRAAGAATTPSGPAPLSHSESALNTLPPGTALARLQTSTSSVKTAVQGHISSSTTITDTCVSCHELGELRHCTIRRKRFKMRHAPSIRTDRLVKSSSFSGRLSPQAEEKSERSAASDPTASHKHRMSSSSSADSGPDVCRAGLRAAEPPRAPPAPAAPPAPPSVPDFRVGAAVSLGRARAPPRPPLSAARLWQLTPPAPPSGADSDRSLAAHTEEHSSFSEQAWDFYQEKYNSEPYSEAPDSEAARRLLEFGDDYRAFLDSQSDGCSSLSHDRVRHRQRRVASETAGRKSKSVSSGERRRPARGVAPDLTREARRGEADSDLDEHEACVSQLVRRSAARLLSTEALLLRDSAPDLLPHDDYSEVAATCAEHLASLDSVLGSAGAALLSPALLADLRGVSARWSALRSAAVRRGNARRLRRELATLHDSLQHLGEPRDQPPPPLHTRQQLNRRIDELKERLARLLESKVCLLKLTVSTRRALATMEAAGEGEAALAGQLAALLAAWDELHHRTSSELLSLERAVAAWGEWEAGVRELSSGLRSDRAALRSLVDGGRDQLPPPLRRLADVLGEKKSGSTCGSLSDSGISDGDSEAAAAAEAATGARARRLAALRDLARQLQAALAPGSHALHAITKRMEQAESEVRALQESCRALVAAGTADSAKTSARCAEDSPPPAPPGGWVWRVLRSALPFQLCLVALLLAAWLLERPRCCDLLNSLAGSFSPQLRYVRGPPPT